MIQWWCHSPWLTTLTTQATRYKAGPCRKLLDSGHAHHYCGKVSQMHCFLPYIHSFFLLVYFPCSGLSLFQSFIMSLSPVLWICCSLCLEWCLCFLLPSHFQVFHQSGFKCHFFRVSFFAPYYIIIIPLLCAPLACFMILHLSFITHQNIISSITIFLSY